MVVFGRRRRLKGAPGARRSSVAMAAPPLTRHHRPKEGSGSGRSRKDWTSNTSRDKPSTDRPGSVAGLAALSPVALLIGGRARAGLGGPLTSQDTPPATRLVLA